MRRLRSPAVLTAALMVLAMIVSACAGGDGDDVGTPATLPALAPTTSGSPTAEAADVDPDPAEEESGAPTEDGPPADEGTAAAADPPATEATGEDTPTAPDTPELDDLALGLREIATLDAPIALAAREGDPNLYVAERAGRVRAVSPDGSVGEPLIDISDSTSTTSERGLLGIAWSPAGDRLFLSSTDADGATRLEQVDVVDGQLQVDDRAELLRVPQPAANHNGGNVLVGPDGMLWLGLGDGGAANDQFGQGQRPDTLLAAMLRLDVDGGDPYGIPGDNPFADGASGAPEVWAYGLRNPWRFSFDAETGELWIADVGQNAVEEINRVPAAEAGLNYGWPRFEGDRPFDGEPAAGPVVEPVHTYGHDRGCSITGGYVYRGQAIPELRGAYLYTDFCSGDIWALDVAEDGSIRADVDTGLDVAQPVSFGEGPDGELYVLSLGGAVVAITPA